MIKYNGLKIETTKFPNGEICIKPFDISLSKTKEHTIDFYFQSNEDLILLMMIKGHLDENGIKDVLLMINYMPYSRMDRSENGSIFTLKYVADFINKLNFSEVRVKEAHSDVTPALIKRCKNIHTTAQLGEYVCCKNQDLDMFKDVVYYPDSTAYKRYHKDFDMFKYYAIGNKIRNFETGKILSLEIIGNLPKEPFKVIMVDDLCSRGGTFLLGAKKLRELGATDITLVVTHCENSIFDGEIFKNNLINRVYCLDTMVLDEEKLKQTNGKLIIVQ